LKVQVTGQSSWAINGRATLSEGFIVCHEFGEGRSPFDPFCRPTSLDMVHFARFRPIVVHVIGRA